MFHKCDGIISETVQVNQVTNRVIIKNPILIRNRKLTFFPTFFPTELSVSRTIIETIYMGKSMLVFYTSLVSLINLPGLPADWPV